LQYAVNVIGDFPWKPVDGRLVMEKTGKSGMTISAGLRQRIKDVPGEPRPELYGERACPQWGTKFTEMELAACEIGDAITSGGK
jgi:hypothetical protein